MLNRKVCYNCYMKYGNIDKSNKIEFRGMKWIDYVFAHNWTKQKMVLCPRITEKKKHNACSIYNPPPEECLYELEHAVNVRKRCSKKKSV